MPVNIKGNDYVMVKERVGEFNRIYPNGSITSENLEMTERIVMKTTVIPDVENPERKFTGYAYEREGSNQINRTSALENCETSSIGRALGFLGLGVIESIASAEEVANAIHQQNNMPSESLLNEAKKLQKKAKRMGAIDALWDLSIFTEKEIREKISNLERLITDESIKLAKKKSDDYEKAHSDTIEMPL